MTPSPTLAVRTDRSLVPANKSSTRYLLVRLTAPPAPAREGRTPVNVSLVLDRSGSMNEERKFPLARQAVDQALQMLRAQDCFSVVVYDDAVDVLAPSSLATQATKEQALEALDRIAPRGSTNLGAGWLSGCEQVANHLVREDSVSRCLLLTDGLANQGIQNRAELAVHAAELHRRGVATSTFGVGADFDERLLRDMAHEGGGNFYFIDAASQIPRLLTSELGEAIEVTVRNAVLEITLPDGADAELLSRFRHRRALGDNELRIELGDLVSEQELAVVIKVTLPARRISASSEVGMTLTGRGVTTTTATSAWTHATDAADEAQARDVDVDREVARLQAALARAAALEANRAGDFIGAARTLSRVGLALHRLAGDDAEMLGIVADLEAEAPEFVAQMPPLAAKAKFFAAEALSKSRDSSGGAKKARDS